MKNFGCDKERERSKECIEGIDYKTHHLYGFESGFDYKLFFIWIMTL